MLTNKVILITGSTTGIGAATAKECVAQGAKVMIQGRNEARAQELCAQLGSAARYFISDLENVDSYAALVAHTVDTFGALHGLVNNAGIYPRNNIDSSDATSFDHIMAINAKTPLLITKEVVKVFRQQGSGGSIVNIGSMNAYCGQPDLLIYSMSKGALMSMTRNLADALGPEKIRVNLLNVGWTPTETEILLKKNEGLPDNWQQLIPPVYAPIGRLQTPTEVAHHIVFWLADYSAPVSGAVYEVEQYPIIGRNRISDLKL